MKLNLLFIGIIGLAVWFLSGCASTPTHDLSALQGNWLGHEIDGPPGESHMTISGDSLRFKGARQEEWYDAKLILLPNTNPKQAAVVIQNCSVPQYNGKTAKAIYRMEGKTLTIAANEPGDESLPNDFERTSSSRARVFVFKKQG